MADEDLAVKLVHVAREAVDLIAGELAETEAALRGHGDAPVPERVQLQARAVKRLAVVLRHAAEQFKATAEAIDVWVERRS